MNKRLIIDCQLLQTKTWHRGMGKYSAKLLDALTNQVLSDEFSSVTLIFNKNLTYESAVENFVNTLKGVSVDFLALHVPKDEPRSITLAQKKNKKILDDHIALNESNDEVYFMIASLFLDEACPVFPTDAHKSLVCYDLIPLMYYKLYLGLGPSEQYFTRFSVLFEADAILAISETVANDIVSYIGIPKDRIFNIRGASNWTGSTENSQRPNLPIQHKYILMPTGGDPRKNNLNGVIGFERFNRQNGYAYQLIITSMFTAEQRSDLNEYSNNLLFTGNVTDNELCWLYENAEVVLFPTEYEGLGMPVLEAIDADKLIACSDIPVFREISSDAFFMFDPRNPESISNAIEEAVIASGDEIKLKKRHYAAIQQAFTWTNSARDVMAGLNETTKMEIRANPKSRIAIVTPNISYDSELSRYVALSYASLARSYNVDFYYDMSGKLPPVRPNFLGFTANVAHLDDLTDQIAAKYELLVYFIEDDVVSKATIKAASSMPGVVICGSSYQTNLPGKIVHFASHTSTLNNKSTLVVTAGQLAYPLHRQGLDNKIFISLDSRRPDDRWNIDYIKDIVSVVDASKTIFTVVTKTKLSEEARNELAYTNVSLYEHVADHEYNVLLNTCDLFVDARPGIPFTKLFALAEAHENHLTVFSGNMGATISGDVNGYSIAKDGAELRDMTFRWLMRDLEADYTRTRTAVDTATLKTLIDREITSAVGRENE